LNCGTFGLSFEEITLNFREPRKPIKAKMLSVIIGRNGTCKSTLLRCLALAMCSASEATTLLSQPNAQMISSGKESGSITIRFVQADSDHTGEITLKLEREGERDIAVDSTIGDQGVRFFVCGYGAGRGSIGDTKFQTYQVFDSVTSLFDYEHQLLNPELMLRRLEDRLGHKNYRVVAQLGKRRQWAIMGP
jgi:predicted ATPase